jgi:hypothetical protein
MTDLAVYYAYGPTIGAGSTVTNAMGLYVRNQGAAGVTNAYGVRIRAQSGASTSNIGLYNEGSTRLDGSLTWQTDNTYDIGAVGATRPRNIYAAGGVATKTKAGIPVDSDFTNPIDGMLAVDTTNHALYFRSGGTWRSIPNSLQDLTYAG